MQNASVKIIAFGEQGVGVSAAASRISTSEGSALDAFNKSGNAEKDIKLIGKVLLSGHNTVIEHMYVTVAFNDVSVLTEQAMIEHRLAAYTVKSRRYVNFSDAGFLVPENIGEHAEIYAEHMRFLFDTYSKLLELNIPREDARFVLPYCFRSNFIMSADMREMILVADSMARGRLSVYPEIKRLGEMLFEELKRAFPAADKATSRKPNQAQALSSPSAIPSPTVSKPSAALISAQQNADELLKQALNLSSRGDMSLKQLMRDERPRELEMLNYVFKVSDVSLATLTHFTRHRIQSLVVPQIIRVFDKNRYVLPESVASSPEALQIYTAAFEQNALVASKFINEPTLLSYFALAGNTIDIMFNMNARELIHFLRLRTCNRAQWEIRALAQQMLEMLKHEYPRLFKFYGPSCAVLGYCPEGRLSCRHPVKIEEDE